MKLYEVTNGHMGFSYVRCLIIAENEEKAKDLARIKYKEESTTEGYYNNLQCICLCDDTSKIYVGNIED